VYGLRWCLLVSASTLFNWAGWAAFDSVSYRSGGGEEEGQVKTGG